jgi:hypothetical protein
MNRMYVIGDNVAINLDFLERIECEENALFFQMNTGDKEFVEFTTPNDAKNTFYQIIYYLNAASKVLTS